MQTVDETVREMTESIEAARRAVLVPPLDGGRLGGAA